MGAYLIRRLLYALPILIGVNLLLFFLFFNVNTPDDMAEAILGEKHVTQDQIDNWKRERGYHLPLYLNTDEAFPGLFTQTILWQKSVRLFVFDFGKSDHDHADISRELLERIPYSLAITLPAFLISIFLNLFFAMIVAFYRGTYVDLWMLVLCVIMMSVSALFYIIGGQYILSIQWRLFPVSGFDNHPLYAWKFLFLPIFWLLLWHML